MSENTVNKAGFEEEFLEILKTPPLDEYTRWLELKNREIVINEQIDSFQVESVIMNLIKWNREDKDIPVEGRKPIQIYLNTPGGDMFVGLIIAEAIKKSKTPVYVQVIANAASMGSIILSSGHVRRAFRFSNVLIHDGTTGIGGSTNKVKDTMKFFEEKEGQLKRFLVENTKITSELYDEKKDREWWMTAEQALELGLIDEIIEEL